MIFKSKKKLQIYEYTACGMQAILQKTYDSIKQKKIHIMEYTACGMQAILQKTYDSIKQIKIYGYIEETLRYKK